MSDSACKKASAGLPAAWTVSVPFASSNDTFTVVTKPTGDLCRPYKQDELWLYHNGIFVQTLGCKNQDFRFVGKYFVPSGICSHVPSCPSANGGFVLCCGADVEVVNPAESARSYSSVHANDAVGTGHARSMLDSAQAWSALTSTVGQFMTISLGSVQTVMGVVTQGRAAYSQWVSSYKVQTSPDCSVYSDVDGGRVFSGNVETYSQVPNFFTTPVQASCVRLLPQSWVNFMSMRAGVVVSGGPVSSLPLTQ